MINVAWVAMLQKRCLERHIYANYISGDIFQTLNTNEASFRTNGVEISNLDKVRFFPSTNKKKTTVKQYIRSGGGFQVSYAKSFCNFMESYFCSKHFFDFQFQQFFELKEIIFKV